MNQKATPDKVPRRMNPNSLANMTPGQQKDVDKRLQKAFQNDVFALWSELNEESGKTRGQEMLRAEAEKNPGKVIKMVADMMPKGIPTEKKSNEVDNFANALIKLNKSVGNARATKAESEVLDIEVFETTGKTPVKIEED